jgi:aminopeptidase N
MQVYLLEQDFDKAEELLDIFEKSVGCHEKYFGEYPWVKEKMAVCQTPHLGMEHQSLNAYGNKFNFSMIADTRFDWLLHHEFGHEWWANKVTNIDWADMWIQEGICTFGDALFRLEYAGERMYLQHMQQVAINIQNKLPVVMGKDLDVDTIYHSDIYGKGAFFMHTLKFVIGDEKFFPILKKLATDPAYTYDNLVCTEDVEKLFSKESGQDLKPLFDLFLRTTEKLEIHVRRTKVDEYELKLLNLSRSLPFEVQTSDGVERIEIGPKPVAVRTKEQPIIDPNVYYFKKVIVE